MCAPNLPHREPFLNLAKVETFHLTGRIRTANSRMLNLSMEQLRTLRVDFNHINDLNLVAPKLSHLHLHVLLNEHIDFLQRFIDQLHSLTVVFDAKESYNFYTLKPVSLRELVIDRRDKGMTKSERNVSIAFFKQLVRLRRLELSVKFIDSVVLHTLADRLGQLVDLSLEVAEGTIELKHITNLSRLESLRIVACRVNLQNVHLPALRSLQLGSAELPGTYLEGIEGLMAFHRLRSLTLINVKFYPEVLQLTPTYSVERMVLAHYRKIEETHLQILVKRFPALRWLRISHCYGLYKREIDKLKRMLPLVALAFDEILRIVDSVCDLSTKLYILYYITCNALDGDDRVNAAYACYQFAREHESSLAGIPEAKDKIEKIYRKYPVLKTQQLLQQNGVTEEKQFQLVKNPQELLQALYTDSCFQKVKVNELAATIGQLHGLDVEAIQMGLLQKWLHMFGGSSMATPAGGSDAFHNGSGMLEETLYDDHNVSDASQEDESNVHECMARAYYILSSWQRSKSVEFLVAELNSSLDASHGQSEVSKQLQIYQCFSRLADDNCTSYREFFTQRRYVALKCVHLLKALGMHTLSVARFEETDKMGLLKMLWQSHATNPKGLEVLSLICIGYDIYVPQIWNGILKQMARLGLVENLRSLIDIVTAQRQLFGLEGYRMAWELLIKQPFHSANREQSLTEDALLARSLVMVQKCPISFRLNLLEIADVCVHVSRINMAAVLLGFTDEEQREALKKLIATVPVPNLHDQIRELEEFGLASTITKAVCRELQSNSTDSARPSVKKLRSN